MTIMPGYTGGYTWDQVSPWIIQFESGGNPTAYNPTPTSSGNAEGLYQITTGTWNDWASKAGVSLSQYPTPNSAPADVQGLVAQTIFNARGLQPWSTAPQILQALASGASPAASAASQALTNAANAGNPNVGFSGQSQQTGWLYDIFDTISSFIGRSAIMIMGGVIIAAALLTMALQHTDAGKAVAATVKG